jgi:CARDB
MGRTSSELSTTTQQPVIATTDLAFQVTIKDSGDSPEVNIPVTLTIEQTPAITKKQILRFINPGEEKTVTFRNLGAPQFTTPVKVKVVVNPVPGEHNTTNNTSEYPVIFSLPQ